MDIEQLASGLGWPEGPTVLPDGRVVFVESYRSQLSVWAPGSGVSRYAYTAGAPNSSVLGKDGAIYVCQNGGTVGPWRAAEMTKASIQRVDREGGKAEIIATSIEGIALNGPNDLVFGADGRLYFTDPGTYRPADPEPSYIFALDPDRHRPRGHRLPDPGVPQRAGGRGRRLGGLGRVVHRARPAAASGRQHRGPGPHARRQPHPRRHEDRCRWPPVRDRHHRRRHPRAAAGWHGRGASSSAATRPPTAPSTGRCCT